MFKKIVTYLKYYFEPDSKALQREAFDSAKKYFSGKSKTVEQFQAYQRGYKNAYRSTYADFRLDNSQKGV